MKQTFADRLVGLLAAVILLAGGLVTWQTYQQRRVANEMGGHMESMAAIHGTHPLWYLFGTLLTVTVVVGVYAIARDQLSDAADTNHETTQRPNDTAAARKEDSDAVDESEPMDAKTAQPEVLALLPDDERRVLEPVLESPGLTQVALRDRSGFSKSKVSQTVSNLEERGLLYREPQGRTFRVYPSDDLESSETQASGGDERSHR